MSSHANQTPKPSAEALHELAKVNLQNAIDAASRALDFFAFPAHFSIEGQASYTKQQIDKAATFLVKAKRALMHYESTRRSGDS
jgi:hypothetical protein